MKGTLRWEESAAGYNLAEQEKSRWAVCKSQVWSAWIGDTREEWKHLEDIVKNEKSEKHSQ